MSVTVRMDPAVKAAIASIGEHTWTTIKYPHAILDEATGIWVSKAEVTEVPFTAFMCRTKADRVPGRLVVRRIPDVHAEKNRAAGQGTLFDLWRFHAFFTTVAQDVLGTVAADSTQRARDHRTGPRPPQGLRAGAPAERAVRREQCQARPGGHLVQPHPNRRHPHRGT